MNLTLNGVTKRRRIGDLMVSQNLISPDMLNGALELETSEGAKIVEVLIKQGHLTIDEFVKFLSRQSGIDSIDLAHYQIAKEIISLLPVDFVVKNEVFPIDKMGSLLTLGDVDKFEIIRASQAQMQKLLIDESTAFDVFDEIEQMSQVHFSWDSE